MHTHIYTGAGTDLLHHLLYSYLIACLFDHRKSGAVRDAHGGRRRKGTDHPNIATGIIRSRSTGTCEHPVNNVSGGTTIVADQPSANS